MLTKRNVGRMYDALFFICGTGATRRDLLLEMIFVIVVQNPTLLVLFLILTILRV